MRNATAPAEARTGPEPKCADCDHGTLAHNAIGGACTKCDCGHFRAKAEAQTPRERMTALVNRQPLATLATSLLTLDAKPSPDEAERLARAVIIDSITGRCPAADAAFDAWADSDDEDRHNAVRAIVAAVKGA